MKKYKIVFIGAGRLASNLAPALLNAGHSIVQVYSRTAGSASLLADKLHCGYTTSLTEVVDDADVYFFSVSDSALAELAKSLHSLIGEKLFVHTAGSMNIDVLPTGHRAVFYPMQTFVKDKRVDFKRIPCFIEASTDNDLSVVNSLANDISEKVYKLSSQQRQYLHLSAVFTCNFVNHFYAIGEKLLEKIGLPFDVLLPLIDESAEKVHTISPFEGQTGPAIRKDMNVINKQLQMLKEYPEWESLYQMITNDIINIHNK